MTENSKRDISFELAYSTDSGSGRLTINMRGFFLNSNKNAIRKMIDTVRTYGDLTALVVLSNTIDEAQRQLDEDIAAFEDRINSLETILNRYADQYSTYRHAKTAAENNMRQLTNKFVYAQELLSKYITKASLLEEVTKK